MQQRLLKTGMKEDFAGMLKKAQIPQKPQAIPKVKVWLLRCFH